MCARREKGTAVCRAHRRTDRELSGFPLSPHNSSLEYSITLSRSQTNTFPLVCICICCSQTTLLSFCFCAIIIGVLVISRNTQLTPGHTLPSATSSLPTPTIRYITPAGPFCFSPSTSKPPLHHSVHLSQSLLPLLHQHVRTTTTPASHHFFWWLLVLFISMSCVYISSSCAFIKARNLDLQGQLLVYRSFL